MKLLNIPMAKPTANLKIKNQVAKEAEWRNMFEQMEAATQENGGPRCLKTADEEKNHNNEDLTLEKIFFINLDKSEKRRQVMEKRLNSTKYHVERWSATTRRDANEAHYKEFSRRGKNNMQAVHKGTVATYLSHTKLMRHISEQTNENGVYIILEDDAQPHFDEWADEVMCQIKELPKDWEVYKFGFWNAGGGGACQGIPNAGTFSC